MRRGTPCIKEQWCLFCGYVCVCVYWCVCHNVSVSGCLVATCVRGMQTPLVSVGHRKPMTGSGQPTASTRVCMYVRICVCRYVHLEPCVAVHCSSLCVGLPRASTPNREQRFFFGHDRVCRDTVCLCLNPSKYLNNLCRRSSSSSSSSRCWSTTHPDSCGMRWRGWCREWKRCVHQSQGLTQYQLWIKA